jgi:hypothetical protein
MTAVAFGKGPQIGEQRDGSIVFTWLSGGHQGGRADRI